MCEHKAEKAKLNSESVDSVKINYKVIIEEMHRGVAIEDDPKPYECEEGYDGLDPKYPDRRWHLRVERDPIKFPDVPENDTRHASAMSCEKHPHWWRRAHPFPKVVEPDEYSKVAYAWWLQDEREQQDDWDAEEEELAQVSPFEESGEEEAGDN